MLFTALSLITNTSRLKGLSKLPHIAERLKLGPQDWSRLTDGPSQHGASPLSKEKAVAYHSIVMKAMFMSKRARPDVQHVVSFLSTRTTCSTSHDWAKLSRMMNFLHRTKDEVLKLSADGSYKIIWYVDAAFAVHPNMRSHTGAIMTMGKGAIQTI